MKTSATAPIRRLQLSISVESSLATDLDRMKTGQSRSKRLQYLAELGLATEGRAETRIGDEQKIQGAKLDEIISLIKSIATSGLHAGTASTRPEGIVGASSNGSAEGESIHEFRSGIIPAASRMQFADLDSETGPKH